MCLVSYLHEVNCAQDSFDALSRAAEAFARASAAQ